MSAAQTPQALPARKPKRANHAHHGGAWKVAYADFVTAMMALFMVLWLLSQTDQAIRQQLSEYFRTGVFTGAPSILPGGSGLMDKGFLEPNANVETPTEEEHLQAAAAKLRGLVEDLMQDKAAFAALGTQIEIKVTERGLLVEILDNGQDVLFGLSSAELKPSLIELLQKLAPLLAQLDNRLEIHGHTDARPFPTGSDQTNWSLSFERADRARSVLTEAGVPETKFAGVFAHAANEPAVDDPLAAQNRRLALLAVRMDKPRAATDPPPPRTPAAAPAPTAAPTAPAEEVHDTAH